MKNNKNLTSFMSRNLKYLLSYSFVTSGFILLLSNAEQLYLYNNLNLILYGFAYSLLLVAIYLQYRGYLSNLEKHHQSVLKLRAKLSQLKHDYDVIKSEYNDFMQHSQITQSELELARQHACECNENKSEFLASVSHEIRTPLNAILGYTELLAEHVQNEQKHYLNNISQGGEQLLALINDLLDLSRLEAGVYELNEQPVEINQLLDEVCELLLPLVEKCGLVLFPLFHESIHIQASIDKKRLQQIVINLMMNAIHYTPQGHIIIRGRVSETKHKQYLELEIMDTGLGMTRDQIERLCTPFVRHHSHESELTGTGLGMAICQQLIQLLDGQLCVNSEVNEGTLITLLLPLHEVQETTTHDLFLPGKTYIYHPHPLYQDSLYKSFNPVCESVIEVSSLSELFSSSRLDFSKDRLVVDYSEWHSFEDNKSIESTFNVITVGNVKAHSSANLNFPILSSRMQSYFSEPPEHLVAEAGSSYQSSYALSQPVLIIDDRPENLELMRAFMAKLNIQYTCCDSGVIALERYQEQPYSIVFVDIRMPVLDGIECCKLMRQVKNQSSHFVALTASATSVERRKILDAGFDDFVTKPISMERIKQVVRNVSKQSESGINWSESIDLCGSDEQLAQTMLQHLLDEVPKILEQLTTASQGTLNADQVHQWAGLISYCGTARLKQQLIKLEKELRNESLAVNATDIEGICHELSRVMAQGIQLLKNCSVQSEHLPRLISQR